MITRPLELASKLQREPRSNDWMFIVNLALIAVFFSLWGSKFVLAPSLGVEFRLPQMAGADAGARPSTHQLSVTDSGQIFVADGPLAADELPRWLAAQIAALKMQKNPPSPVLLVQASARVQMHVLAKILGAAGAAGFEVRVAADEPKSAPATP
jgi:biopolymer transport protein ExbD